MRGPRSPAFGRGPIWYGSRDWAGVCYGHVEWRDGSTSRTLGISFAYLLPIASAPALVWLVRRQRNAGRRGFPLD